MHIDFLPNKNLGAPGRPGHGKGLVAAALSAAAARQERAWRRSLGAEEAAGTCFGRSTLGKQSSILMNFDDPGFLAPKILFSCLTSG